EIEERIGSKALLISEKPAKAADSIVILSGQLHKSYSCQIEALVYNLIEGDYIWQDSLRYSRPGCEVVGGTSGSPILNQATGEIIGLNNTGNQGGKMCSDGSPCEVSKNGSVYAEVGFNYGQQVYSLATCFVRGQFNLNFPGCESFH
ncbi:MAG: serine protease, partial [Moraxellaceae bacterium]|nr:serine protease [Pseudobdellovibrionaceae bacterium]